MSSLSGQLESEGQLDPLVLLHEYLKILNTLFHIILALILLFMQLFLKMLSGMANSVDPDQTAPSGAV